MMPTLDQMDAESDFVRIIYVGHSGSGKTGSLVSLVKAGYKLRMIDLDNGFGILKQYILHECPELLSSVGVISFRDKYKATPSGVMVQGSPTAYIRTMEALDKWPDDDSDPSDWGDEYILVIDSLTRLGFASYAWQDRLNPTIKDKRQIYRMAQDAIIAFLQNLTSETFRTNVIVSTHIDYNETETKGFASAIGKAVGPKIPTLFNNLVMAESVGSGNTTRRVIRTVTTGVVDLKNEKPFDIDDELPLSSGLATLFEKLKGDK